MAVTDLESLPRVRVAPPRLTHGQLHCPRCAMRLLLNYDVYVCVGCGYEWEPAPGKEYVHGEGARDA